MRFFQLLTPLLIAGAAGCGTTRWSDTARTATEQLLISDAVDQSIGHMDFKPLAQKLVYLDPQYLDCTDKNYVISTLRQHMLAEGCVLMPNADAADYVVEVRSGAVGTNHHDVLLGVPAISVPAGGMVGIPSIPEIPFAKTTDQKGIAKLACFAYNRETGQAVWQSGTFPVVATAKDSWFLGTGPFQRGTIYDGTHFAGERFFLKRRNKVVAVPPADIPVTANVMFPERSALARKTTNQTSANAPAKAAAKPAVAAPGATVTGSSGPSLPPSGSLPAANQSIANSGTNTGLPSGQVVRLPALPESQPTSGSGASGGLSLNPNTWLRLK